MRLRITKPASSHSHFSRSLVLWRFHFNRVWTAHIFFLVNIGKLKLEQWPNFSICEKKVEYWKPQKIETTENLNKTAIIIVFRLGSVGKSSSHICSARIRTQYPSNVSLDFIFSKNLKCNLYLFDCFFLIFSKITNAVLAKHDKLYLSWIVAVMCTQKTTYVQISCINFCK